MNIGVSTEQAKHFLREIDPFGFEKIIYSDLIKFLSTQKVSSDQLQASSQPEWSCNNEQPEPLPSLLLQSQVHS